ncbi:MAG: VOC family protein [Mobilicoccus sp.]|nr:VOC family protein [Mobilicoccus sp.]
MSVAISPYLTFPDTAAAALEHYRGIFGGTVTICTYADSGLVDWPDSGNVFRGTLTTDTGAIIVCADTPAGMTLDGGRKSVALDGEDRDQLERWLAALAEGGLLELPLGHGGGVAIDRFGVRWIVTLRP